MGEGSRRADGEAFRMHPTPGVAGLVGEGEEREKERERERKEAKHKPWLRERGEACSLPEVGLACDVLSWTAPSQQPYSEMQRLVLDDPLVNNPPQ